jgi:hypothetical protein
VVQDLEEEGEAKHPPPATRVKDLEEAVAAQHPHQVEEVPPTVPTLAEDGVFPQQHHLHIWYNPGPRLERQALQ